ncbi:MAG: hypothetical protein ACRELY_08820 [Polyangiaceae bacterium]
MLTIPALRKEVGRSVVDTFVKSGLIEHGVDARFGLAAGYVKAAADKRVRGIARQRGWEYLGPSDIAHEIWKFADLGYENSPFVLTAKLLKRHLPK